MITVAYIHRKPKGKRQVFGLYGSRTVYRCQVECERMQSKTWADAK
jgi:hypothetical protein